MNTELYLAKAYFTSKPQTIKIDLTEKKEITHSSTLQKKSITYIMSNTKTTKRGYTTKTRTHPRNKTSSTKLKKSVSSILPTCLCYVSIMHSNTPTHTEAFSPGAESILNKNNKKCHGVACPRSSTTLTKHTKGRLDSGSGGNINTTVDRGITNGETHEKNHFALKMANYHHEQELIELQKQLNLDKEQQQQQTLRNHHDNMNEEETLTSSSSQDGLSFDSSTQERRLFLASLFATTTTAATSTTSFSSAANAFEKAYPVNLDFDNDDTSINLQSLRQERIAVQKSQTKQVKSDLVSKPYFLRDERELIGSVVWGGALWLLLGSRSNPLVRPLANLLYDENTEDGAWVKDRNEGLFAPLPLAFTLIMGVVFLTLGFITDRGLLFIAEGQSTVVLQLAGVSLIGGAALELGRIASGEKMLTRDDLNRQVMLADEFQEFATKRLIVGEGGAVHRSEVIRAFRRYFAKYRVENEQYPLTDLEIERLLRTWNRREGNAEGLSSAGFLKGVKINEQAIIQ